MHEPVLLKELIEILAPQPGDALLDNTAGYGGHASEIFKISNNFLDSTLVDRDQQAIDYLQAHFMSKGVEFMRMDFYTAAKELIKQGKKFDLIIADLGVSSPHLDIASRGFSFSLEGPLDMRMDQNQQLTAEKLVNEWPENELANCIFRFGDEKKSRRIAKAIVAARPITSTTQLAQIISRAVGKTSLKKHPATKTFQALRIAVNSEVELLEKVLPLWLQLLKEGGRLGIISFHSLEDRIVKSFFVEQTESGYESQINLLNKKPITATDEELVFNPRARSAKLRAAVKIKTKERTRDEN